jgi:hypothetical protein
MYVAERMRTCPDQTFITPERKTAIVNNDEDYFFSNCS